MSSYVYSIVIDVYHLCAFWKTVENFQFTSDRWTKRRTDVNYYVSNLLPFVTTIADPSNLFSNCLFYLEISHVLVTGGFYQHKKLALKSFLFSFIFKLTKRTLGLKGNICFSVVFILLFIHINQIYCAFFSMANPVLKFNVIYWQATFCTRS